SDWRLTRRRLCRALTSSREGQADSAGDSALPPSRPRPRLLRVVTAETAAFARRHGTSIPQAHSKNATASSEGVCMPPPAISHSDVQTLDTPSSRLTHIGSASVPQFGCSCKHATREPQRFTQSPPSLVGHASSQDSSAQLGAVQSQPSGGGGSPPVPPSPKVPPLPSAPPLAGSPPSPANESPPFGVIPPDPSPAVPPCAAPPCVAPPCASPPSPELPPTSEPPPALVAPPLGVPPVVPPMPSPPSEGAPPSGLEPPVPPLVPPLVELPPAPPCAPPLPPIVPPEAGPLPPSGGCPPALSPPRLSRSIESSVTAFAQAPVVRSRAAR